MQLDPKICNLICILVTGKNLFTLGGRITTSNTWKDQEAQYFINLVNKYYSPWDLISQFAPLNNYGRKQRKGYGLRDV